MSKLLGKELEDAAAEALLVIFKGAKPAGEGDGEPAVDGRTLVAGLEAYAKLRQAVSKAAPAEGGDTSEAAEKVRDALAQAAGKKAAFEGGSQGA